MSIDKLEGGKRDGLRHLDDDELSVVTGGLNENTNENTNGNTNEFIGPLVPIGLVVATIGQNRQD